MSSWSWLEESAEFAHRQVERREQTDLQRSGIDALERERHRIFVSVLVQEPERVVVLAVKVQEARSPVGARYATFQILRQCDAMRERASMSRETRSPVYRCSAAPPATYIRTAAHAVAIPPARCNAMDDLAKRRQVTPAARCDQAACARRASRSDRKRVGRKGLRASQRSNTATSPAPGWRRSARANKSCDRQRVRSRA